MSHRFPRRLGVLGALSLIVGLIPAAQAAVPPSGPLDVDEAVRIALQQNHAYLEQAASVGVASGSRLNALAGLLPALNGDYTYSRRGQSTTLADFAVQREVGTSGQPGDPLKLADISLDSHSNTSTFSFGAREDLSFSTWYTYRSAEHNLTGARHGLDAAAQSLAFDVRSQFYLVLRAQDLLGVQEEDLRLARDEERRITSMFELGSVARVDVLKAKVRVADAEVALIRQRNQVAIERARMATLLGFSPDSRLELAGNLTARASVPDSTAAAQEAMMRPDVKRAEATLESASALHKAAVTSRLPGLFAGFDASTTTGRSESEQVDVVLVPSTPPVYLYGSSPRVSDINQDGWSVTGGASINLDAFFNAGRSSRAGAAKRQAEEALAGTKLAVQQELEEALLTYRASISAITSAEAGVAASEEDLRLSEERYQQGLGTALELLESQVNLTRARNTRVNALTSLKVSEAALDKARGAALP